MASFTAHYTQFTNITAQLTQSTQTSAFGQTPTNRQTTPPRRTRTQMHRSR